MAKKEFTHPDFPQFQYGRKEDDGDGGTMTCIYDEPDAMDNGDTVAVYQLVAVKKLSKRQVVALK